MTSWKLFAFGSAIFAGLTAILAKVGVEKIPSNLATFIRTVVIILFLGGLISCRKEWENPWHLPSRSLIFLVLSGLATGLSWICYYRALQLGPASLVAPIDKLSLVLAVVLSVLFLHERLNGVQWAGAMLMAFGAILVGMK
jgi:transporter family protein